MALEPLPPIIVVQPDPDLLELIPWYLENRQQDLQMIATALPAGDFETIRRVAHQMKGTGGSYGFDGISEIGARMERAAGDGDATYIQALAERLTIYLSRVQIMKPAGA